ncbi:HAMP domain-containing histidine kinase [Catenovulum sp. 2E275]|uniref:sensor histidine kinase n=1 Tax=Catenovulum sp. 2E275 TaxID=2980497 RepID=UPI0021D2FC97|nr:HAMP domain-containing sensor histidine kinase [Catenovulum sp. 2E275]MCU4677582.1 HAMP domain-containing histidine kinase [Catenovulum sp. 2E275]
MLSWQELTKSYTLTLIRLLLVLICIVIFLFISPQGMFSWLVLAGYLVCQIILQFVKWKQALVISHWVDLIGFSLLLYLNGSAMNGAISILYVPIISASILLSQRLAWSITAGAIAAYSWLIWQASFHSHHHAMAEHLQGMWLTFVFSVIAMTWFMSAQRLRLIRQRSEISNLKEQQMRDEQILAVATYAANTAHQLSTPLFTIGMLVDELKLILQEKQQDKVCADLLVQLSGQLDNCQQTVKQIAQQAKLNTPEQIKANDFMLHICKLWWNRRNEIQLNTQFADELNDYTILTDLNLEMAILNLLDNAADAGLAKSSSQILLTAEIIGNNLFISIQDYGSGFDMNKMAALGLDTVSEKNFGMGIGLILANAAIERNNGEIILINNDDGALTQIRLPLSGL